MSHAVRTVPELSVRRPYLALTSFCFRVNEVRTAAVRSDLQLQQLPFSHLDVMATPPGRRHSVNVESIAASFSRLQVGAGSVEGTPKSSSTKRTRCLAAKRTLLPQLGGPPVVTVSSSVTNSLDSETQRFPPWTVEEEQALVNFMLLYTEGMS